MSSRATGTSSLRQRYCCFRREPQPLCSMLNEIDLLASVAEKSLTGIDTSPNETVSEAMERAAMERLPGVRGRFYFGRRKLLFYSRTYVLPSKGRKRLPPMNADERR